MEFDVTEQTTQRRSARPGNPGQRFTAALGVALAAVLLLSSGCTRPGLLTRGAFGVSHRYDPAASPDLPLGTRIIVAMGCTVSSGTARTGDAWHGTVTQYVRTASEGVIPPGSEVSGVVTLVSPARWREPAVLALGIRSIRVNGQEESILASAAPLVAGSPLARSVCATAGGAAADSFANQVVLSDVTVMTFTVDQTVAMR
jgi:hypothetical protein